MARVAFPELQPPLGDVEVRVHLAQIALWCGAESRAYGHGMLAVAKTGFDLDIAHLLFPHSPAARAHTRWRAFSDVGPECLQCLTGAPVPENARRAEDEDAYSVPREGGGVCYVDTAGHLDSGAQSPVGEVFLEDAHPIKGCREHRLSGVARLDGHDEHAVNEVEQVVQFLSAAWRD